MSSNKPTEFWTKYEIGRKTGFLLILLPPPPLPPATAVVCNSIPKLPRAQLFRRERMEVEEKNYLRNRDRNT